MTSVPPPDLIPLISLSIGAGAVLFAVFRWWLDIREKKIREYMYDYFSKKIEIEDLTPKLREMSQRYEAIRDSINTKIPELATETFRRERLNEVEEQIGKLYMEREQLLKRLPSSQTVVPEDVRNIVERQIMPRYLIRARVERLKTLVVFASIAVGVAGALFPLGFLSSILWLIVLVMFIRLGIVMLRSEEHRVIRDRIRPIVLLAGFIISGVAAVTFGFLAALFGPEHWDTLVLNLLFMISFVFAGLVLFLEMKKKGILRTLFGK